MKQICLQNTNDNHFKFYNLLLKGNLLIRQFGRIGKTRQVMEESYENDVEAQRKYNALIDEKYAKGYKQVF